MTKVTVTYGKGDPKKGSVRMKPLSANHDIDVRDLGDLYVSRSILKILGIKDTGAIGVTFESPDNPLI